MSKLVALILCIGTFLLVQIITWFQLNGQFFSPWFKNNVFLLCLLGLPISWLYIEATRLGFIAFDGVLWPGRLLGFAMGMLTFAVCANIFMGEGLTNKTIVSLILATIPHADSVIKAWSQAEVAIRSNHIVNRNNGKFSDEKIMKKIIQDV